MFLISSSMVYKQTVYEVWNYFTLYFINSRKNPDRHLFPHPINPQFRRKNSHRRWLIQYSVIHNLRSIVSGFLWTSLSDIFSKVSIIFTKTLQLSLNRCTSVWSCKTNNFQAFALRMKCHFNANKKTDCMYKPR